MRTFYLEPKDGDTSDPNWAATSLKEGCWVKAESESNARRLVELAGLKTMEIRPGQMIILHSPWLDPELTSCEPTDAGPDIIEGVILPKSARPIDA